MITITRPRIMSISEIRTPATKAAGRAEEAGVAGDAAVSVMGRLRVAQAPVTMPQVTPSRGETRRSHVCVSEGEAAEEALRLEAALGSEEADAVLITLNHGLVVHFIVGRREVPSG